MFAAKRSYNGGPVSGSHEGIDIAVPLGTPVHASAAGTVSWTGELPDRGQGVIIDHGLGVFTGYYHLSEIRATLGAGGRPGRGRYWARWHNGLFDRSTRALGSGAG